MKKSIKTIAFALLTVGMLAGCQPKPSPVSKNWDDDTQKAMNLFFGEVLPFVELNAETTYVDVSYDAGLVEFVVGDDSEVNVMEGYDSKLTAAGWTLTSMEGEDYYIKENDAGYQMILEYGYYEATEEHAAGNEIYVMSLLPDFKEWNEDLVHLIFAINDKEYNYFQTPAFEAANATFLVDTYVQDYGFFQVPAGAQVVIDGATAAEVFTYAAKLCNEGWTVTTSDEGTFTAQKAIAEIDGIATVGFFLNDGEKGDGYVYVISLFSISAIPTETFPADKIAAGFAKLGLPAFEIPAPDSTGHTFEYRFDYGNFDYLDEPSYCYDYVYINDMTEEQFNAYVAKFETAGWTVEEGNYDNEYSATKHIDTAKATASVDISWTASEKYGQFAELTVYYIMEPDPSPDWPTEDLNAAFAALGLPAFPIPAPEGEGVGFKFKFDDGNLDYLDNPALCYDNVQVYGLDEDGVTAYFAKLEAAGWEAVYQSSSYVEFNKHFEDLHGTATIRFYNYSASYGYDYVRVYYILDADPSPVWPAEEIAELLGEDVTDTLPECTFAGATFKCYDDAYGMGVTVFVGEDNVAAAMEAYATTLTTAGFIPGNTDGSFISPNSQFTVDLIEGIDGAFLIELALVRHLNSEVSAFLASRGKSVAFPDLSSYESYGVDWDYTGVSSGRWETWINGNHEETLAAAFAAAGYTGTDAPNEDVGAYLMYDATDSITVQMAYVASYQQTLIRIYPSHVEPN